MTGLREALSARTSRNTSLLIECKRYKKPVGVKTIRALLGVVSDEKVNKGVLVTTSSFTRGAKDFAKPNPRIELISGNKLVPLLNEFLGPKWPLNIESIVIKSLNKQNKSINDHSSQKVEPKKIS